MYLSKIYVRYLVLSEFRSYAFVVMKYSAPR